MSRGLLVVLVSLILSTPALAGGPVYIAIIIDDMGNNQPLGEEALRLPGQFTYSILPFTPYARAFATAANDAGREVMLHEPMANVSGARLGPGALTRAQTKRQFIDTLDGALASVPHARGINNHMGSYLTQQSEQMRWLMDDIKRRHLYFIDSRTTPKTVALEVAREKNVDSARRDVFLDDVETFHAIDRQFQRLLRKARQHGTAIAIAHPHKPTLDYLIMAIPRLREEGVRLVPVSNLIARQQVADVQYARGER